MKKIILFLVGVCLFVGCNRQVTKNRLLTQAENQIDKNPEGTYKYLSDTLDISNFDDYNKACYYLLLAEATLKTGEDIYPMDSLINIAISDLQQYKDPVQLTKALYYKGVIFEETKSFPEAIKSYQHALEIIGNLDNKIINKIYNALGYIYITQELFDEGLQSFETGYELALSENNFRQLINYSQAIGLTYLCIDDFDNAEKYYHQALALSDSLETDNNYKDILYNSLALYYSESGDNESALLYINKLTKFNSQNNLNKGAILFELNQLDSAYYYIQNSLETKEITTIATAYQNLSDIEKIKGNLENALEYQDSFIVALQSLVEENYTAEIHGINIKNNIKAEITRINNSKNTTITIIIFSAIILILSLLFYGIGYFKIKKKKTEKEKLQQENRILEKEKEISNLQNIINNTRHTIEHHPFETEKTKSELEKKEIQLKTMQNQLNNMRVHALEQQSIYRKIKKLSVQKDMDNIETLNIKEREALKQTVETIYVDFVAELNQKCTYLSDEDLLFCCLGKLNFSLVEISICTGYPRMNSARQRRYRIKKKMEEQFKNDDLYNSIFPN